MIKLNLDQVMKEQKVKLKDLAEEIGLTDANLSNIKTGKVFAIRFSTLNALCKALNCQPADILEYVDDEPSH
ncbi:MAG: helix-turn-helix transcriptional regulator [Prevotella sp.]|nr:helix-turn-helix transcriptional regulator [Prevotella sp.]